MVVRDAFTYVTKTVPFAPEDVQYVYVTTKPNNQQGILYQANVTAFNGSTVITSGKSNTSGIVTLTNVPFGDITFVAYAKSDYSQVIANATVLISEEGQSFDLLCDQNYGEVSISWNSIIVMSLSTFTISLPLSLFSSRMLIKKDKKTWNRDLSKEAGKSQFPRRKTKKGE